MIFTSLNSNIDTLTSEMGKRNIKTVFTLVEANADYVLPSFTQICVVTVQTGTSVSMHSIIGAQTSASSVIGTPVGVTSNVSILKNGVNNAYVKNSNSSAARLVIQYY